MLTAFGYDWVPGNLAGALALREAGDTATRIDVGYFTRGGLGGMSGGTRASAAGRDDGAGLRLARRHPHRARARARRGSFTVGGSHRRPAISVGASEHFTLPRIHPGLREVNAYLGWFAHRAPDAGHVGGQRRHRATIPGAKTRDGRPGRAVREAHPPAARTPRPAPRPDREIVAVAYGPGGEELSHGRDRAASTATRSRANVLAWGAAAGAGRRDREEPARSARPRRSASTPSRPAAPRPGSAASAARAAFRLRRERSRDRGGTRSGRACPGGTSIPPRWAAPHRRRGGWSQSG